MIAHIVIILTLLTLLGAGGLPALSRTPPKPVSTPPNLANDETVVLFPSRAVREEAGASGPGWVIRLRGWVFERETDSSWRSVAIDRFGKEIGLHADEIASPVFRDRARAFLADNERGKRIAVRVAGRTFIMPATGEDGHFQGVINLSDADVLAAAGNPDPNTQRRLELLIENAGEAETIIAPVRIVETGARSGLLVVCDIDDTIKISNIDDRQQLLRSTFVEPFAPVPGMSELLTRLAAAGRAAGNPVEFHYLSASPWQLYEPLAAFLRDHGFPEGCITLREFRMKDERIGNLFANPTEYKLAELARLTAQMPDRKLVLIGDSTEHDAELYAEFARKRPGRVLIILIRLTPGDEQGTARTQKALRGMPGGAHWIMFQDPATVRFDLPELRSPDK